MSESMTGPKFAGLLGGASTVIGVRTAAMPGSYTLVSTDGTRKIEFSCDGVNYFQPTYDASPAAYITVAALAPIVNVRFTGAATDTYTVL